MHPKSTSSLRSQRPHPPVLATSSQWDFCFNLCTLPLGRYVFCLPRKVLTQQAAYQTSAKSQIWDVCVKEHPQGNLRFPYETFPLLANFTFLESFSQRKRPSPMWQKMRSRTRELLLGYLSKQKDNKFPTTNFT